MALWPREGSGHFGSAHRRGETVIVDRYGRRVHHGDVQKLQFVEEQVRNLQM